ncbi:hypothetical protein K491DRAFT_714233 [Lophiostoma macrostomum CBS 122681]|uniref:F-box domain-containing protein n=1 Tax=Lophiostoma macrostomum CBS 122681 TaxID=1314788 RepID=A0A6A6TD68_9PLEO|nr:hypothetical protein K491DRAFT_714233 [Lophiostoma macrostomum CBS 122681]
MDARQNRMDSPGGKSSLDISSKEPSLSEMTIVQSDVERRQHSRLLSLPRELKDLIIASLGHPRRQDDLNNVSRACRQLREGALPELYKHIDIDLCGERGAHLLRPIPSPATLSSVAQYIRTLRLRAITDGWGRLTLDLIQAAPQVTTIDLDYTIDQRPEAGGASNAIDGNALSSGLAAVKDTLEHLKISYTLRPDVFSHAAISGYCSLKQLETLRTAEIPFFLLLSFYPRGEEGAPPSIADVLPAGLDVLKFSDDEWGIDQIDWMEEAAWNEDLMMEKFIEYFGEERWRQTTPKLTKVVLSLCKFEDKFDWKPSGGVADFEELCTSNGLECEVYRHRT